MQLLQFFLEVEDRKRTYKLLVFTFSDGRSKQRMALAQTLTICKPSNRYPVICLRKSKHKCDVRLGQSHNTRSLSGEQHRSDAPHRKQHELSKEDMALMASYMI